MNIRNLSGALNLLLTGRDTASEIKCVGSLILLSFLSRYVRRKTDLTLWTDRHFMEEKKRIEEEYVSLNKDVQEKKKSFMETKARIDAMDVCSFF